MSSAAVSPSPVSSASPAPVASPSASVAVAASALLDAPLRHVDVGDCQLAHRVVGEGPDLVFVHGWPMHGMTWRNIVPLLADRFRCHVFDLPGTGDAIWTPELSYRVREHAARVVRAIDAAGIESCATVGHDSGAAITRHVAAELGDRVWANVLSGSEISGHRPLLLQVMLAMGNLPFVTTAFRTLLRSPALRRSRLGWGACFWDVDKADGDFHARFGQALLDNPRALDGQQLLARDWDWADTDALSDAHARITGPSLLIWGEGDPYFPAPLARKMAAEFAGGARFICRPDGRLFVHEEHPDWFAAEAGRFLDQVVADGSVAASA